MSDFHRRASDVRARDFAGYIGQVLNDKRVVEHDAVNSSGGSRHVVTMTVTESGGDGLDDCSFTLGGRDDLDDYAFVFAGSAAATTSALLAAELVEAINMDSYAQQFCYASLSGSTTVVLTAPAPGTDWLFTVTEAVTALGTPSATAATDPAAIEFGLGAFAYAASSSDTVSLESGGSPTRLGAQRVKTPLTADLTAQVQTVTPVGTEGSKTMGISLVSSTGKYETFEFETNTTVATTVDNIVAALAGSEIATVTDSTTHATFTAIDAGATFTINTWEIDATTQTFTVAQTVAGTDVNDLFGGVVAYKPTMYDGQTLGVGPTRRTTSVPVGDHAILVEEGPMLVEWSGAAPARNAKAYLSLATATSGRFYAAAGSERHKINRVRFTGWARDGVAEIFIHPR